MPRSSGAQKEGSGDYVSHLSKLLVSPLIRPIVLPYTIPLEWGLDHNIAHMGNAKMAIAL